MESLFKNIKSKYLKIFLIKNILNPKKRRTEKIYEEQRSCLKMGRLYVK